MVLSSGERKSKTGTNVLEFTLLIPWYVFLFVGTFDFGIFAYSLIATQAAGSAGAAYCAASASTCTSNSTACGIALDNLRNLPNVGTGLGTCGTTAVTTAAPVAVQVTYLAATDSPDKTYQSASVQVIYQTPQLVPIPGLLSGQLTITRVAKMPVRS
jgi:Flp pilus assembly protein TadG